MELIKNNPNITRKEKTEKLNLTVDGVRYHLCKLSENGIIRYIGTSRKGYWKILWLKSLHTARTIAFVFTTHPRSLQASQTPQAVLFLHKLHSIIQMEEVPKA